MAFVGKTKVKSRPATIEDMYKELPRTKRAVPGLWLHQGDIVRSYVEKFEETPDLALELPTGTGKTLPGLIICEWVRQGGQGRVAYACPTSQLARQVAQTAKREGIPSVVLVGSHYDWSTAEESRYEARDASGSSRARPRHRPPRPRLRRRRRPRASRRPRRRPLPS